MISMSLALQNAMLTQYGVADMMQGGVIECYSGIQPSNADQAVTGTHLGTITHKGQTFVSGSTDAGLRLSQAGFGRLEDDGNWVFTASSTGTIGWWRWRWNKFDPGTEALFYPRVDGLAGQSLVFEDHDVIAGQTVPIDKFILAFRG